MRLGSEYIVRHPHCHLPSLSAKMALVEMVLKSHRARWLWNEWEHGSEDMSPAWALP